MVKSKEIHELLSALDGNSNLCSGNFLKENSTKHYRRLSFSRNYSTLHPINYNTCFRLEREALSKIYFSFTSAFNVTKLINRFFRKHYKKWRAHICIRLRLSVVAKHINLFTSRLEGDREKKNFNFSFSRLARREFFFPHFEITWFLFMCASQHFTAS